VNREKNNDQEKPVALVTGGSRGIGLGIATELAKAGYNLAINGMRPDNDVKNILEFLRSFNIGVIYIRGNVADRKDRITMIERVTGHWGRINVLVNNAGIAPPKRFDLLEATPEIYDVVMDTNLKGPYFLTQLVARQMVKQKMSDRQIPCCIINISSVSATVASVNRGEYCISKAGITMATRLWAVRLSEYDIPVYEIRPGIIKTDMTTGVAEKYNRLLEEGLCLQKRWGTPQDVGKVAVAMANGSMPYSTGQVVMVDGGMTIPRL
jgi:3-oxoacyl-[acyl-carrier protein] reductase